MEKVMEISWKIYGFFMLVHGFFMEKMWRFCVRSIVMEKMWRNHRESMESLWNFDGDFMCIWWIFHGSFVEELWNLRRSLMEKILDWNMEKLWSICGELEYWKIVGWKIPKRAKLERDAKQTGKVEKCLIVSLTGWKTTSTWLELFSALLE